MFENEGVNLAALPPEQRRVVGIDTECCFWLFLLANGKVTLGDIQQKLAGMKPDDAQLYRERLKHWQPGFKKSVRPEIDEKTWQRMVAKFRGK